MSEIYYGCGISIYSVPFGWCVKYRCNILVSATETDVKELVEQIDRDNDGIFIGMELDKDRIHLLIECKPQ